MSYNPLLDFWFGHPLIAYLVPLLGFGLIVMLYNIERKKRNKRKALIRSVVLSVICIIMLFTAALINPLYIGYGTSRWITEMHYMNGHLYVTDFIMTAGGEVEDGIECSRIHILNTTTGEKKRRILIGPNASFLTASDDSIGTYQYNTISYYSTRNGRKKFTWTENNLPRYYPELASGIDHSMWGNEHKTWEIFSKDGREWNLNTATGILSPGDQKSVSFPASRYVIHDRSIRLNVEGSYRDLITLSYKNNNQLIRYIYNGTGDCLNETATFLEGSPVAVNSRDSSFIIVHYETTDKDRFILTCMQLDGTQKIWEHRQREWQSTYTFDKGLPPQFAHDEKAGNIFFNIGRTIYALSMKEGALLWQQKL